jgi:hypothetical protein
MDVDLMTGRLKCWGKEQQHTFDTPHSLSSQKPNTTPALEEFYRRWREGE